MVMTFLRYWGPVWGYAGLIFYLSSLSHPEDNLPLLFREVSDKVLHAVEYAGLGALCYRAFRWGTNDILAPYALWLAIVFVSLYGVTDEIHQSWVPFRDSSWQDWVADGIGATIGAVTMHRIASLSQTRVDAKPSPALMTRR
jgi:VanZ family protein